MKSKSILISEKKNIRKYNPSNDIFEWEHEFEYKISGISRIDDLVIVTTYSNWGKNYTSLLSFETGEKFWEIKNVFYSIHIIENIIIFLDKNKFFNGIDIKTGTEKFKVKSPFTWTTPKIILIKNTYFIFSSKKTYHLNINNGKIMETKLPNKINPKELGIVLDEFQININSIPSSDAGYMYIGDAGAGGDFGGGDAGGGGGDGG